MTLYQPTFLTQFDGGLYANQNCTPTSAAMAADQSTSGAVRMTGSQVRALLAPHEETNPATPGWSLPDARKALSRVGVSLWVPRGGASWTELLRLRAEGRGIVLQGDSDQFTEGCSAAFDGDHAIYLPAVDDPTASEWRKGDPICPRWTTESEAVIRAYADKYARTIRLPAGNVSFGYTARVPEDDMAYDPVRDVPVAICDVAAGGELLAADKHTRITTNWAGGAGIGLYWQDAVVSGWSAIRRAGSSNPADPQYQLNFVPNSKVGNIRIPGAASTVTITGQGLTVTGP